MPSFRKFLAVSAFSLFLSCTGKEKGTSTNDALLYFQPGENRVAAEWEPAIGTMLTWPLSVPYKLVIELAKDNHLYTLVNDDHSRQEALQWYLKWGIDTTRNTFVVVPQGVDAWWVRDWGPAALFSKQGEMKLVDGRYIYSTPVTNLECNGRLQFIFTNNKNEPILTATDDSATSRLADQLHMGLLPVPFINTGGNFLIDGLGTAFSTCIIENENQYEKISHEKFLALNKDLLGIERYHIISNFEKYGIQHIDCLLKLLDEERIMVAQPPADHPAYPIYERIVNDELKKLKTIYGRPYEIVRIKTNRFDKEELAAYTNSIIINKTVYVPLFRIAEDSLALKTWQELMPGYAIKGFTYALSEEPVVDSTVKKHYGEYGWKSGDALHCRTRAIWDPQMLFITVRKLDNMTNTADDNKIHCTIIDYSGKGLLQQELNWRVAGDAQWNKVQLKADAGEHQFFASLPQQKSGTHIEYFISASSKSGRLESMPRTAPLGFYKGVVK